MRSSALRGDPGYANFLCLRKPITILVDGVKVEHVHTADEEIGIAVAWLKHMGIVNDRIPEVVYFGRVQILAGADAQA